MSAANSKRRGHKSGISNGYRAPIFLAAAAVAVGMGTSKPARAQSLTWVGDGSANAWNFTGVDWLNGTNSAQYVDGASVLFNNTGLANNSVNLNATVMPSLMTVNTTGTYTLSGTGALTGSGELLVQAGTLNITNSGGNTFSGGTVISAGATLNIGNGGGTGDFGTGGPVTNNGSLIFNHTGNTYNFASTLSGTGLVTIPTGMTLSGDSSNFTGEMLLTTNSNAQPLVINSPTALGASNSIGLVMALPTVTGNSILLSLAPNLTINTPLTMNTGPSNFRSSINTGLNDVWAGPIKINGSTGFAQINAGTNKSIMGLTLAGPITATNAAILIRGTGIGIISGQVTNPLGSVEQTDAGTWTISSTGNSWIVTEIATGTLVNGANNALPTNSLLETGQSGATAGGVYEMAGFSQQVQSLTQFAGSTARDTIQNSLSTNLSTLSISTGSNDTCTSQITGTLQLVMDGTGTLKLANTGTGFVVNNYTGGTLVQTGTLQMGANNDLPVNGYVVMGTATSGGKLDLNGFNAAIGSLAGTNASNAVALGGATLTIGNDNTSTTYSGNIADAGGANTNTGGTVIKTGSGTLNLASSTGLTLPNLTVNSGTVSLGGATGATAPFNVSGTMTINDQTEVAYLSHASGGVTNTVSSLVINGAGQLDLANHALVTTTDPGTIRQYLIAGANVVGTNPATWNGPGGIISSNAAASTNHLTALGYSSGTHSALGIALGLASNQTVVKYTIMGDANLDGSVDISDLDIVLSNYASGKPPTWDTGDFTYAGQTDITDLNIVLSNYAKTAPASVATPTVARSSAKASASTSSGPQTLTGTVSPAVASGAIELDVNTMTGDAVLNPNNAKVVSLQVASSSGNLIPNNWHDLSFYYGTPNWADSSFQTINLAEYDTAYTSRHNSLMLTAPVDYGDIFNTSGPHDLTFEYGIPDADGSDVDTEVGAVVYSSTPEPTTLGLMGLAMAGLMGRRRKSKQPK